MTDRADEGIIVCPRCGHEFPLTDALRRQLEKRVRARLEAEFEDHLRKQAAEWEEKWEREKARLAREARRKAERDLRRELERLEKRAAAAEARTSREVARAAARAAREARAAASKAAAARLEELRARVRDRTQELQALKKARREAERRERQLQDRERKLGTQLQREKQRAEREARRRFETREKELEKQLRAAHRQIRDLEGQLRQGSPQEQGRIVEADFEQLLRQLCPHDEVSRVKGAGADVLQVVQAESGRTCGTFLWEVKRRRRWSSRWVEKLKTDRRRHGAEAAVLVSSVLPRGAPSDVFQFDGLWVAREEVAPALALLLRQLFVELERARQLAGADEAMKALHRYLTSTQFSERISAMAGALRTMWDGLAQEQKWITQRWRQREMEILRAGEAVQGLQLDLRQLVGPEAVPALPELAGLDTSGGRALGPGSA